MKTAEVSCRTRTGVISGRSKRSLYSSSGFPGRPNTYSTRSAASASQTEAHGLRSDTAPLHHAGCQRPSRGDDFVQLDVLVLAVGKPDVAGPEADGRDSFVLQERAVGGGAEVDGMLVARRRDAHTGGQLVSAHHRLHDRMLPRRVHRRPVVHPLEARRVLAQPGVEPASRENIVLDF